MTGRAPSQADPAVLALITQGRAPVERRLRLVLADEMRRMRGDGQPGDLAVEILLQAQIGVFLASVTQLVAEGPERLRVSAQALDLMRQRMGLPRETILDGEMLR